MKRILFSGILFLSLFISACEKDIQLDLPDQKQLVIFSNFTPDSLFRLHLSTSIAIDSTEIPTQPEHATIQLFEDGNYLQDFIFHPSDDPFSRSPYYYVDHPPKTGSEYEIVAELPGYPPAETSNIVPPPVNIESFELLSASSSSDPDEQNFLIYNLKTRVKLSRQAEPGYFHIKAWRSLVFFDVIGSDTIKYHFEDFLIPDLSNEIAHLDILHEEGALVDGSSFSENEESFEINFSFFFNHYSELKAPVYIELRHVSQDYYLFHKSVGEQEYSSFREGLLSTQSTLIHNNIKGGLGNFGAYGVSIDSLSW